MKKILAILLLLSMLITLTGCKDAIADEGDRTNLENMLSVKYDSDDYYYNWKNNGYSTIRLNENEIIVNGSGVVSEGSVATISTSGIYEVTGTLNGGGIIVDIDKSTDKDTVFIVLNNASISSEKSAPIHIKDAKKVVLILEEGTENFVFGGSEYVVNEKEEPTATIFSKSDLTITGSGTLEVIADYNDGINSRDNLKITDGILNIASKADGIVGKDSISIENGNITVRAGKDGIRSTNKIDEGKGNILIQNGEFEIIAENDAIQAFNKLQIDDGKFNLRSGGGYPGMSISSGNDNQRGRFNQNITITEDKGESKKGLKAGQSIVINGGNINVSSYDDTVHSDNDIVVNDGIITLESGDDGLHADNNIYINSGEVSIKHSYEGLEGKNITINGGKININSTDDGINIYSKEGILIVRDGEIAIFSGDDGIDSNGDINMTGGTIYVNGPTTNNNAAIDYDGIFTISGGTLLAAGSSGMAQAPGDNSTQPSILMYFSSIQTPGTTISLKDAKNTVVVTYTPSKEYNSVVISSPNLTVGSHYTLYSGNNKIVDVTISSPLTYLSESGEISREQTIGPGGGRVRNQQFPRDGFNEERQLKKN